MQNDFVFRRLSQLSQYGFSPRTILDIGAYHGDWTRMVKIIFPKANIFMVEATPDNEKILESVYEASGYEMALLGEKDKKKVLFFIADPKATDITTGNSRYMEKTRYFNEDLKINLPMTTLDGLVKKKKLKNIDFIKIDTQGSERDILKGGKKVIKRAEFILLETQNLEYNSGAPFMEDIIIDMKDYGFRLFDIVEIHYLPTGELFQVDLLFANKNSKYLKGGKLR